MDNTPRWHHRLLGRALYHGKYDSDLLSRLRSLSMCSSSPSRCLNSIATPKIIPDDYSSCTPGYDPAGNKFVVAAVCRRRWGNERSRSLAYHAMVPQRT
ncbi:hypothetical protein MRB53_040980 [Persea americana]|nr:hypothetical protein MRB53_040980 [Persea americana]